MVAHRLSYRATHGDAGDKFVCHKCDTPSCVNPDHLFAGTNSDNLKDCYNKGRRGKIHSSVFPAILQAMKGGQSMRKTAKAYGVTHAAIYWRIKNA